MTNKIIPKAISKTLWDAAYYGELSKLSKKDINESLLLNCLNYEKNAFHAACINAKISKFPTELLTNRGLRSRDGDGNTCYHILAYNGWLSDLPKGKLDTNSLKLRNNSGFTPLHSAASNGKIDHIISLEVKFEKSILSLKEKKEEQNVLHLCARTKCLKSIPLDLIDEELLSYEDIYGNTTYHTAAQNSCLNQINNKFITIESLTKKNKSGLTPIDYNPNQLTGMILRRFTTLDLQRLLKSSTVVETKRFLQRLILIRQSKEIGESLKID
jgi:ankyrin repeat protein